MEKIPSLIDMLIEKFNKELPHLTFGKEKAEGQQTFRINNKLYEIKTSEEVLTVTSGKSTTFISLTSKHQFKKIPKELDWSDAMIIFETVVKITGKSIALYTDNIGDHMLVESYITL